MREIGLVALLCLLAVVGCTAREEEPEAATPEVGTAAAQPATAEAAATSTKELKGTIVRGVCEAPRPPAKGTEGGVAPANVQDSEGGALSTGYGQVTLVNRTSVTLDLYVSGSYGCRALKGTHPGGQGVRWPLHLHLGDAQRRRLLHLDGHRGVAPRPTRQARNPCPPAPSPHERWRPGSSMPSRREIFGCSLGALALPLVALCAGQTCCSSSPTTRATIPRDPWPLPRSGNAPRRRTNDGPAPRGAVKARRRPSPHPRRPPTRGVPPPEHVSPWALWPRAKSGLTPRSRRI